MRGGRVEEGGQGDKNDRGDGRSERGGTGAPREEKEAGVVGESRMAVEKR